MSPGNIANTRSQLKWTIANLTAVEKNRARYPDLIEELGATGKHRLAYLYRSLGRLRRVNGMPGHGREEMLAAVGLWPYDLLSWKWLLLSSLGSSIVQRLRRLRRMMSMVHR